MQVDPDAKALLKKRILTLAEYAKEVRHGVKLSKSLCRELYGSSTAPIPVPLKGYESFDQYEARFVAWVTQERSVVFQELRTEPTRERVYRLNFARQEAYDYNARRARALAALDRPEPVAIKRECIDQADSAADTLGQKRDHPRDGMTPEAPPSKRAAAESIAAAAASDGVASTDGEDQLPQPFQAILEIAHEQLGGEIRAASATMSKPVESDEDDVLAPLAELVLREPPAQTAFNTVEHADEATGVEDVSTIGIDMDENDKLNEEN